jgi:hypothetical protein
VTAIPSSLACTMRPQNKIEVYQSTPPSHRVSQLSSNGFNGLIK